MSQMDYSPTGTALHTRNVLIRRRYWWKDELRTYMLDLGIVDNIEDFENAVRDLLEHGYAREEIVDGRTYLSSSLPIIP